MAASDIRAGGAYIEVFTKDISLQRGLQAASKHVQAFSKGVRARPGNGSVRQEWDGPLALAGWWCGRA